MGETIDRRIIKNVLKLRDSLLAFSAWNVLLGKFVSTITYFEYTVRYIPYSRYNLRGAIFANHQIYHPAVLFAIINLRTLVFVM